MRIFFSRSFALVSLAMTLSFATGCNLKSQTMPTRKTVVEDLGPAPTVTNISPSSYGVRGGATVTLTGTNFTSSTTVSLGGSTCGSVSFVSSTSLTCVISYHGAAVVDVVATNPDGQTGTLVNGFKYNAFLYATAGSTDRIYSFVVDSGTKAVSATTTPFLATCDYPYGVDVDPTNQFVYVACYNNSGTGKRVHWFSIDHATGNLTFVNQVTANNRQLAGIAVSPVGGYAFTGVYEATGRIQAYSMDSVTGALTWLADYTAGSLVSLVAADPLGRFVFSADNGSSSVTKYVVNTSPSFSLSNPQTLATSVATSPDGICVHPSGQYVYAAGASNPGYAVAFSVNSSDGTLTEIDVENHGANASSGSGVITDPSGSHLYITAYSANRVYGYTINPSNGTLTALGNWATGGGPNDVRIQSLGNLVVTANRTGTSVTVFSRDLGTGLLSGAVTSSIGVGPDIIAITY